MVILIKIVDFVNLVYIGKIFSQTENDGTSVLTYDKC